MCVLEWLISVEISIEVALQNLYLNQEFEKETKRNEIKTSRNETNSFFFHFWVNYLCQKAYFENFWEW